MRINVMSWLNILKEWCIIRQSIRRKNTFARTAYKILVQVNKFFLESQGQLHGYIQMVSRQSRCHKKVRIYCSSKTTIGRCRYLLLFMQILKPSRRKRADLFLVCYRSVETSAADLQIVYRSSTDYLRIVCRMSAEYLQNVCRNDLQFVQTFCRRRRYK